MMPSLLRFREYVEAAKLARHRAESERHPHAKQILQEIERSYHRLVEFEKWAADQQQYNRSFAHFGLFNGHAGPTWFAMREDILSRSADQQIKNSADQQIKNRVPRKDHQRDGSRASLKRV
jgi:hypothetical protein